MNELEHASARTLVSSFEADWLGTENIGERFVIVDLTNDVLEHAARLTSLHDLRGYDAVQLASGIAARGGDAEIQEFVCFDHALSSAAEIEGFEIVPGR